MAQAHNLFSPNATHTYTLNDFNMYIKCSAPIATPFEYILLCLMFTFSHSLSFLGITAASRHLAVSFSIQISIVLSRILNTRWHRVCIAYNTPSLCASAHMWGCGIVDVPIDHALHVYGGYISVFSIAMVYVCTISHHRATTSHIIVHGNAHFKNVDGKVY